MEEAQKRLIVVATHSHLFLNRADPPSNWLVEGTQVSEVQVNPLENTGQLVDLTFSLLGSDTQDLFFPYNYLIVEGASECTILNRVAELLQIPAGRVKVLAAGGIARVGRRLSAVEDSLTPLVVNDSPYKGRVVAMIDSPNANETKIVDGIRGTLGDRLVVLGSTTIEEQLPVELYIAAGRDKTADLAEIEDCRQQGDRTRSEVLKASISRSLSSAMTTEHIELPELELLVAAVKRATA